jgi:hypothetical protein
MVPPLQHATLGQALVTTAEWNTTLLTLAFTEVCAELDNAGYSEERIAYMTGETVNRVATTLDRLDGLHTQFSRPPSIEPVADDYRRPPVAPMPAGCGTTRGYWVHARHKEPIDEACREAYRIYKAERRALAKRKAS